MCYMNYILSDFGINILIFSIFMFPSHSEIFHSLSISLTHRPRLHMPCSGWVVFDWQSWSLIISTSYCSRFWAAVISYDLKYFLFLHHKVTNYILFIALMCPTSHLFMIICLLLNYIWFPSLFPFYLCPVFVGKLCSLL